MLSRSSAFRTDTLGRAVIERDKFSFILKPTTIERAGQQVTKLGTFESVDVTEFNGMLCYMAIGADRQELPIFLDDAGVTVKITTETWPDVRVSGSKVNADFLTFKELLIKTYPDFNTVFFPEPQKMYAEIIGNASEIYKTEGSSENFQMWVDRYRIYTEAIVTFIQQHPDAAFSSFLFSGAKLYDVQRLYAPRNFYALYDRLNSKVKNSYYGNQLASTKSSMEAEDAYGFVGIGDTAPGINQVDINANPFSLSELLSNDSNCVLVDFWASSCGFCRKSMPFYKQLLNEFGDQGFSVVAYSHDTDERVWKNAIVKDGTEAFYHLAAVNDKEKKVAKDYKSPVTYTIFVLDGDGTIVSKILNHIDLYLKVHALVSKSES